MNSELKLIKHKYGEDMMHLCRRLFPSILEYPGLLFHILSSNFDFSKGLFQDIVDNKMVNEFRNYILCQANLEIKYVVNDKTPDELMNEAGYHLYHCQSEEDIDSFISYYANGERLCTFGDNRLKDNHVFFAVKKDVDQIKREDFINPAREDLYGTSVISIQFSRGDINTLRITNRYNDVVSNPDATFSNNLDNIIPGLTSAFEKKYGFHIYSNTSGFDMPNYIQAMDGKFYKYNFEKNGVYYCPNNIIIDKKLQVHKYDKEKFIIIDHYIIDLVKKEVYLFDSNLKDSFLDGFFPIHHIQIRNDKSRHLKRIVMNDDIVLDINSDNRLIHYYNPHIVKLDSSFLDSGGDSLLEVLDCPNVLDVQDDFLEKNKNLKEIRLFSCKKIGSNFLRKNRDLKRISLPYVKVIQDNFLPLNRELTSIYFPSVIEIGNDFLLHNKDLKKIECDSLERIGSRFLVDNNQISSLSFPSLEEIKNHFMIHNNSIKSVFLPNVERIGDEFLYSNEVLGDLFLPSVSTLGDRVLRYNLNLKEIEMPFIKKIGSNFLQYNNKIKRISFPKLESVGNSFMSSNFVLKEFHLPSLNHTGVEFLDNVSHLSFDDYNSIQKIFKKIRKKQNM